MQKKIFSIYIPGTNFNNYQSNTVNGQIDCNVILAGMFHKCQDVDQYIYRDFYYFSVLLNQSLINLYFSPITVDSHRKIYSKAFGIPMNLECKL